ncbi:MAG: MerR family transcriptional regulator [Enterococcus sp.]
MDYTIKKLADLAGISTRTLRYYDEQELLSPARINASGYRIYTQKEVDRLQQILIYRALDMPLVEIKKVLDEPSWSAQQALKNHKKLLLEKRKELDALIKTIDKTIAYTNGEIQMTDNEKFDALKKEKLATNEALYGEELIEKYGKETMQQSNNMWSTMTPAEFATFSQLEQEILSDLAVSFEQHDFSLDEPLAAKIFEEHKKWLQFTWPSYTPQAHASLALMYITDPRFTEYYDHQVQDGAAQRLTDIIDYYTKNE